MKKFSQITRIKFSLMVLSFLFSFLWVMNSCPPFSSSVFAQDEEERQEEDEDEEMAKKPVPKPVEISGATLRTKDRVYLSATFYPGNRGKKSVPLILLHGWGGSQKDGAELAKYLQKEGHAVLVPDLRGHGKSTKKEEAPEVYKEISCEKLSSKKQSILFREMLEYDLPKLKAYLREENNKGNLNIDKLGIIGIESGAVLAAQFAAKDWNPNVRREGKANPRMGDVKAVILISPLKQFGGVDLWKLWSANPLWAKNLSGLVLCGTTSRSSKISDPESVEKNMLEAIRKNGGNEKPVIIKQGKKEKDEEVKKVYAFEIKTKSQGENLIASQEENSTEMATISKFITLRLKNRYFDWVER
ncbi:MAG: alpha/beta fold hydrolase [Planctomycetia bacterium]|nr:alpha/beta fold hydrolase [Planctomycetia bacterium]